MEKHFAIYLLTILLYLPVESSVIISNNGVINCDGITCPANSVSCVVSQQTYRDLKFYKYIVLCADAFGIPTFTVEKDLPNPRPGTIIDNYSSYGGNGAFSYRGNDGLSEEERIKLASRMEAIRREQQAYWANWASDFQAYMRKQFPPGFPFN